MTRIRTDTGLTGYGWSSVDAEAAAGLLLGRDPIQVERLVADGLGHAFYGAENALWDIVGKVAGQSLHRLWGSHRDWMKLYLTVDIPSLQNGALAALAFLAALTAVTWLWLGGKVSRQVFAVVVLAVILVDTWRIDKQFLHLIDPAKHPPQAEANRRLVAYLQKDDSDFRVLQLPNETEVVLKGVDTVIERHDFVLPRYNQLVNSQLLGHPKILNLLNVKYIASRSPIDASMFAEIGVVDGVHTYGNPGVAPQSVPFDPLLLPQD